jgi:hypothetical protein
MSRLPLIFRALALAAVAGSLTVSGCSCSSNDGQFPVDSGPGDDGTVGMDATTPPDGEDGDGGETATDGALEDGSFIDPCTYDSGVICLGDGGLPDSGVPGCSWKPCKGIVFECGDCIDNDGDGFIDEQDINCLGPCDNNEEGFDLKIPGNPLSGCNRDCYFDDNSGSGNDKCDWALQCDPLAPVKDCCDTSIHVDMCMPRSDYKTRNCGDPQVQDPLCHEICMPLVPNGCDCFGCCDIRTEATPLVEQWVYIGSFDETQSGSKTGTCDMDAAKAGDTDACRPCTPQPNCTNPCGECELCIGKTELPAHCFPPPPQDGGVPDAGEPPPPPRCREGVQPCGLPGDNLCSPGWFCITGCCQYYG